MPGRDIGEAAIVEFIKEHLPRYAPGDHNVLLLFEDADLRRNQFLGQQDGVHLLSTVGLLRGLEQENVIASADAILDAMSNPSDPERWRYRRALRDAPAGTDIPAPRGSRWRP